MMKVRPALRFRPARAGAAATIRFINGGHSSEEPS